MSKYVYNAIGGLSLGLGIIGAFLPLLPTTCFMLLASWAFAKSSPRFHTWLYYKSPFAQSIQNWDQYRVIPTHVKAIATTSIVVSYTITAYLLDNIYVLGAIAVGFVALLAFIFSKPGNISAATYPLTPEWHLPAK